jgi:hypothetical protein
MATHLEEAFYRGKRAALASSFALLLLSVLPFHIAKAGNLYVLSSEGLTIGTIIAIAFAICTYFNISHLLHYQTEVPAWRRDPESGITQVEDVRKAFEELTERGKSEEAELRKAWAATEGPLRDLANEFKKPVSANMPGAIESRLTKRFSSARGELHSAVFNQVSAAINNSQLTSDASRNIRWDVITADAIGRATDVMAAAIEQETRNVAEHIRTRVEQVAREAEAVLKRAEESEGTRIVQLASLNAQLEKTKRQLRQWRSLMNMRLRYQYLVLPTVIYAFASIAASLRLWSSSFQRLLGV